jgi:hypothetical protein
VRNQSVAITTKASIQPTFLVARQHCWHPTTSTALTQLAVQFCERICLVGDTQLAIRSAGAATEARCVGLGVK